MARDDKDPGRPVPPHRSGGGHRVRVENLPGYDTSDDVAVVRQMADDALAGVDEDEVKEGARRFARLFGR